ncbi:free fatty acid receptor 4-like [Eleutherodactylus coqui]|uniref:free fatty acid receptor 4-like n=1 Tax=Eleutherodactylus coqui TaxID=57060 RepID=UPI003461BCE3
MANMIEPCQSEENCNFIYFNFYSEFDKTLAVKVLETTFLSVVFMFSCFVNICAIILLVRKKKLVTADCFVLNLFCSDFLFISIIPLILVIRWTEAWVLGDFFCHLIFFIICLSSSVNLISLSAVSLERMMYIMKVSQATSCNVKVVTIGILTIWGFSVMTALPMFLLFNVITQKVNNRDVQVCTLVWPTVAEEIVWDISFIILDFLIPGLSIIVSYTKIFKITKEIRERMISSTAYSEVHQYRVSQKDYRLFRTLLTLMISFFVMWAPLFIIVLLLLFYNLMNNFNLSPTVFFWIIGFTFCNSIVNPILYNINLLKQKWWRVIFCGNLEDSEDDTGTTTKRNENKMVHQIPNKN